MRPSPQPNMLRQAYTSLHHVHSRAPPLTAVKRTFASVSRRPPCDPFPTAKLQLRAQSRSIASTPPNSPSSNMRGTAALAILCFIGAGVAYYVSISEVDPAAQLGYTPGKEFEQSIRTGRGVQTYKFTYKTPQEIEQRLHEHEEVHILGGFPVVRWDRNWVGSNEPCEDRSAIDLVHSSGNETPADREVMFASVFDGHSGFATSQLLSKELHAWLKQRFLAGNVPQQTGVWSWFGSLGSMLGSWIWPVHPTSGEDRTGELLRSLYQQFDTDNLVNAPLKRYGEYLAARKQAGRRPEEPNTPEDDERFSRVLSAVKAATSGAVMVSAVVDPKNDDLFVVNTGDCRAVAGWQTKDGKWRCDVLTEDLMGDNPREVARMRAEHPGEEDTVIMRGRVLGGLQPTRAMGDSLYKWSSQTTEFLRKLVAPHDIKLRSGKPHYLTPPYVTSRPEVTHRKIAGNPDEKLRFLILATDGLWDELTSEEAVLLVASYLRHPSRTDLPKTHLPEAFPLVETPQAERKFPIQSLPGQGDRREGSWAYEGDANAATHLIRNSLGGGDRERRAHLLSLHGPVTRYKRDDVTVAVLYFDDAEASTRQPEESTIA